MANQDGVFTRALQTGTLAYTSIASAQTAVDVWLGTLLSLMPEAIANRTSGQETCLYDNKSDDCAAHNISPRCSPYPFNGGMSVRFLFAHPRRVTCRRVTRRGASGTPLA